MEKFPFSLIKVAGLNYYILIQKFFLCETLNEFAFGRGFDFDNDDIEELEKRMKIKVIFE